MKNTKKKKRTTFLTILALLLLIIPTGALFADTIGLNTSDTSVTTTTVEIKTAEESDEAKDTDESEAVESEETGEMSDRAVYVADRNAVAETLGIAPGRLNNIDKLVTLSSETLTREELLPLSMQEIQKEIKRLKNEIKVKTNGHNK